MPSEVGGIFLPYREENEMIFEQLDKMLREKTPADKMLDYTDEVLLRQGMGFSEREVKMSRSIWHKLMGRRLSRETLEKSKEDKKTKTDSSIQQLNHQGLFDQYEFEPITQNDVVREDYVWFGKNILYRKKFPTTVALNMLYYFMPYDYLRESPSLQG